MTVIRFPVRQKSDAVVTYERIKVYQGTEDCQQISLCYGRSNRHDYKDSYAVLFIAPPGCIDAFDIIAEYEHSDLGLEAAKLAAEIADRTLACACMHQPEFDDNRTPELIDELCAEAEEIFGETAAVQLRAKLTNRRARC